jgi:hypothetical protein
MRPSTKPVRDPRVRRATGSRPGPSLPPAHPAVIASALTAAACALAAITFKIFDTDFWQHLAVGRAIWELHSVPSRQIWCWPTYGQPFVLPSWGFRALLWPFWKLGGLWGLYAWRWLTTLCAFALIWLTARRMGARGLVALPVLVMAALIYRQRSLVRPETLVAVLLATQLWILETRRAGGRDHSAWIIGIAWAWANVHISYFLGLAVLGVYALEATWRSRRPGSRSGRLWMVLAACVAVSFLNPFGARSLAEPFQFFLAGRHELIYQQVRELQGLDWRLNDRNGLLAFMFLWPLLQVTRARAGKFDPVEGVLWLVLTTLALLSGRFTGYWALVAGLFLARDLADWVSTRRWPAWTGRPGSRAGLASAACVLFTGVELSRADFIPGVGVVDPTYPKAACDFVERHGIRGRSFNHYELGGYLLWRFWPDPGRLPFMDIHQTGTAEIRRDYIRALVDPNAWMSLDRHYRFDWVMLWQLHPPGDRIVDVLDADTAFALVFVDDAAALYVRRSGMLAAVADSFGLRVVRGGQDWLGTLDARVRDDPALGARLERELQRVTSGSPLSSTTENLFANVMLMQGRAADADLHLERAHAVDPRIPDYHLRRGMIALAEGRPRDALREYQAVPRPESNPWLDLQIGSIYRRLGDLVPARRWYQRALDRDPGNQAARDSLEALDSAR